VPAHILVVEDSALVTSAFRMLLEDSGYRVTTAETLAEAIAAASTEPVDLILLDLTLPDGNGLDLLTELGKRGTARPITIAMTGDDNPATRQRCAESGCAELLLKPVSIRELRRTIARHLS